MRRASLLALFLFSGALLQAQTISTFFVTPNTGMTIEAQGTVYLTNSFSSLVRKISSGTLTTIAGNGNFAYTGDGGPALSASLFIGSSGVSGTAVDSAGNVYTANYLSSNVTKITPAGVSSTWATGNHPLGIKVDSAGNVYTANEADDTVTKIAPDGIA